MRKRFILASALLGVMASAQHAIAAPQAPCDRAPSPAFAAPGAPPAVAIFHTADLTNWQPGACTGWSAASAGKSKLVIALAGSFTFDGSLDRLVARVASISTLREVRYWSTTDSEWRPLAYDASALTGPDAKKRRADFSPAELNKGAELYYWENDSRSGEVVTRLSVREHTADAAVIATENVTPIRRFLITAFPPGALQTVLIITRIAPKTWGVYMLSRTSDQASMLAGLHEASYVNRAVALYRQIAGIRTDQELPAIR